MDNTTKNKEKFFAQYWGQLILMQSNGLGVKKCIEPYWGLSLSSRYIELKSAASITDKQAIELCKKAYPLAFEDDKLKWKIERDNEVGFLTVRSKLSWFSFSFSFETGRIFLYDADDLSNNFVDHYACYKYLIEQGFYLGEGEEIEYGWVKLKELEV